MRKFVARLNIDHYREILAVETDGEKRKLIEKLLAEAEAELTAAKERSRTNSALVRPFPPMRRLYVEPLLCCCVNPSTKDSPTGKNKGVCALTI